MSRAVISAVAPAVVSATAEIGDPSALALFARMTTAPSATRKALYTSLITGLKADGVWPLLTAFWIPAAETQQAGNLNIVSSSYTLTAVNSPTWTADRGYTGNGSTSYVDTGANQQLLSQNNNSFGVYCNNSGSSFTAFGALYNLIKPRATTTINTSSSAATVDTGPTTATTVGLTSVTRSASTGYTIYKNGASAGTITRTSAAASSYNMYLGAFNNNGTAASFYNGRISAAFMASALDDTKTAALYARLNTFLTAIGAN